MAKLVYTSISSLDGFIEDAEGNFDWSAPDEEVHSFVNELERPIGTYLYGRRLYETMKFWGTEEATAGQPAHIREYAEIWQAAEKVVYSRTLEAVPGERTSVEREFDVEQVRLMKEVADSDISVGGAELGGLAIRAGLVDELHLFLTPVVVGGGKHSLPDGARLDLELLDEHRFDNGTIHLHYRIRP